MIRKKEILIMGAGGQTRSLIPLLIHHNYTITGILDDTFVEGKEEVISGIKVTGSLSHYNAEFPVVLAYGDNNKRRELLEKNSDNVLKDNLLHPESYVDVSAKLGRSNQIFGKAFVNAEAEIGDNNILNTGCIIEHEVCIGSHNHVSVGAILCGRVKIGDLCFIGAGAVVIDKLTICSHVIIGANSVVIESITEPGTYVGNPARKIK